MQPLQNQNLELVLAVVLKTGTAAVLLGTLCFFVFFFFLFFPFSMAVTDAENRKKIGRGPGSYPVHMLYYATCSPRSIGKSKTHDIECFQTFSPIGDIPVGWEETISSSCCVIILKDALQHWKTTQIIYFLDKIIELKKAKYILICNCYVNKKCDR